MAVPKKPRSSSKPGENSRVRRSTPVETKPEPSPNRRRQKSLSSSEPVLTLRASGHPDGALIVAVICLIHFGVVMVYSASSVWAQHHYHAAQYMLVRQAVFAAIGLSLAFGLSYVDYHWLRPVTYPIVLCAVAVLACTVVGFGHAAGGASRWLNLGFFSVQPAEVVKLAVILWLAHSLAKKSARIRLFMVGVAPHVLGTLVVVLLCLKQPDFGSAVMIALIVFFMLFTAGARLFHLFCVGAFAAPVVYWLVSSSEYRMRRIAGFLSQADNYQLRESELSFGAGGIGGVGFGDSHQKLLFLPEAHTDFISAIIGEELGLIGFSAMVLFFLLIVYRGIKVALNAADDYGTYLAVGITLFIATQAFTNLAVAVGVLPTKGLVLPFVSYGGSSLLVNCCAVGILLNVSRPRSAASSHETERAGALSFGGVT
jgi:cell division protein FtsW